MRLPWQRFLRSTPARLVAMAAWALLGLTVVDTQSARAGGDDPERFEGNYRVTAGEPHPDFTLPRIDTGEAVSLRDYRGKKVLLIQFASW